MTLQPTSPPNATRRSRLAALATCATLLASTGCDRAHRDAAAPDRDARPSAANAAIAQPLPDTLAAEAIRRATNITAQAFRALSARLQDAIQQGGIPSAIPYCSTLAVPLTTAVANTNDVRLQRLTHKPRNPANRANPDELRLIEAWQALLAAGQKVPPQAVGLASNSVTVYVPILLATNLCLNCHGELGTEVSLEVAVALRSQYPRDEAVGFRLGELRGLWRVDFARAALETPSP